MSVDPGPAEEEPYRRLRERITSGHLLPNERLVEGELSEMLGVPRAAVRTALIRLAQDRLVERLPNRGARVRRVGDAEAVEIIEARMALESLVVERAAQNASIADVAALRMILTTMEAEIDGDPLAYGESNDRFHREIARIADHGIATMLLEGLRSRSTLFHLRVVIVPSNPRARLEEHRRIVDAIEIHNAAKAVSEMREHLSGVAAHMRARLEKLKK